MVDKLEKIKEIHQLKENGSITEEEFVSLKRDILYGDKPPLKNYSAKKTKREGIGLPEFLGVSFGLFGGIGYLFTKQSISKKIIIFVLSIITSLFYEFIGEISDRSKLTSETKIEQPESNTDTFDSTAEVEIEQNESGVDISETVDGNIISIKKFQEVILEQSIRVNRSEILAPQTPIYEALKSSEQDGDIIVVFFTLKNVGSEAEGFYLSDLLRNFELQDTSGNKFDSIPAADMFLKASTIDRWKDSKGINDYLFTKIAPGNSVESVEFFRVPSGSKDFVMLVDEHSFAIN